jgi:hypothetical protein
VTHAYFPIIPTGFGARDDAPSAGLAPAPSWPRIAPGQRGEPLKERLGAERATHCLGGAQCGDPGRIGRFGDEIGELPAAWKR